MHDCHARYGGRPRRALGVRRVRRVLYVDDQRSRTRSPAGLVVPSNGRGRRAGGEPGGCQFGCLDQVNGPFKRIPRLRRARISRGPAIVSQHGQGTGSHKRRVGSEAAIGSDLVAGSFRRAWKLKRLKIPWREILRARLILGARMLLPRQSITTRVKAKEDQRQNGADQTKSKTDYARIKKCRTSSGFLFHNVSGCASDLVTRDFSAEIEASETGKVT